MTTTIYSWQFIKRLSIIRYYFVPSKKHKNTNKIMTKIRTLCSITVLFLCGCSTGQAPQTPTTDNATIQLAEAANSVSNSLLELAKIQAAATPAAKGKKLPDPSLYRMNTLASVDWSGPIEPLIKHIAEASNFKTRVLGNAPAIPIIISISAKNTPLANIVRDVDFQAGTKADVYVYPSAKTIELRYAKI